MSNIKKIFSHEIIDSRGIPTIQGILELETGEQVKTSIPAGTSRGKREAVELRDNDISRYDGKGVLKAIELINNVIGPKLKGVSVFKQAEIDKWLIEADGTKNKEKFGANTILTISQLVVKAGAKSKNLPLFKYINFLFNSQTGEPLSISKIPSPIFNVINGGRHANNNLEFQEFQIIPSSSNLFSDAYRIGVELFHELKRVLLYRNANVSVGEEGGYAPNLKSNEDALEVLEETIKRKYLKLGTDIFFGLDIAASNFYKDQRYIIKNLPNPLSKDEYINMLKKLISQYPFLIIEDPLQEDDDKSWIKFNSIVTENTYVAGDDFLVTNKLKLKKAIKDKACSAIIIKPNQIGSVSETMDVVSTAKKNNIVCIVSHRSGETNDTFIADFGVGVQSEFVKFGAPSRGERVVKYNRLWEIERYELNNKS
ncbi:MAG: phosphopyruvate hydratase [bacterium]